MRYTVTLSLSLVAFLSACASTTTVADLRLAPEATSNVLVDMPYEAAYRIVLAESRRCFERTMHGATVVVHGDLYGNSRSAEVSVAAALIKSNIAEVIFDIRATSASTTEITASFRKQSSSGIGKAMQAWLKGDTSTCSSDANQ